MTPERLIELSAKKNTIGLTLPESKELNDSLSASHELNKMFELVEASFQASYVVDSAYSSSDIADKVKRIADRIDETKHSTPFSTRKLYRHLAIAASIIFIFLVGYYFYSVSPQSNVKNPAGNIVSTKKGSKSNIVLPDGTKVWINADTKLYYDESYSGNTRTVSLDGEAFFDVVKDSLRPFLVRTNAMNIKVLGTAFNVRSYPDEKTSQATLLRGIIEVEMTNDKGKKMLLKPNEKIIVKNKNWQDSTVSTVSVPEIVIKKITTSLSGSSAYETQWMNNKMAFEYETIEEIAKAIEKWYDVSIKIESDKVKKIRITGVFENKSLQHVMEALKIAGGFDYKMINDNNIVIQ